MTRQKQIDEFQSMFMRSSHEQFQQQKLELTKISIVTDADDESAKAIQDEVTQFLPQLGEGTTWDFVCKDDFEDVNELLKHFRENPVDLVITHRHLYEPILVPQHSLGVYVDVLTQANEAPVLLLPGTSAQKATLDKKCDTIMVATDHITGDHRLINHAAHFAPQDGEVWLCHVEDDLVFRRYMHAIERIPEIFTDDSRDKLLAQLQTEASKYIDSAEEQLKEMFPKTAWKKHIVQGHQVQTYRQLAEEHKADLLILNTKDQGQMAMHGLAYSISIEIMDRPLLLL